MAKAKLPKIAIQYIIECRDDPHHIRTWQDISDMVKDKFNIDVSLQAVSQTYKRHKDKFYQSKSFTNGATLQHQSIEDKSEQKPVLDFKKLKQSTSSPLQGFDKKVADDIDIQYLLSTD